MQFKALLALFAASTALAAPAPAAEEVDMMAASQSWTIESMKRVCNSANTSCTWTFSVNTHSGAATACKMVVNHSDASQSNGGPATCGPYTVTSGWSGQFGPGNGFTTLAVANHGAKLIAYPAYTDKQLAGGKVVTPNQSYTPQTIG